MDVIGASRVGMTAQLVMGVLVWWLRLRWHHHTERVCSQTVVDLAARLGRAGGGYGTSGVLDHPPARVAGAGSGVHRQRRQPRPPQVDDDANRSFQLRHVDMHVQPQS
jgi:hypothetical protein